MNKEYDINLYTSPNLKMYEVKVQNVMCASRNKLDSYPGTNWDDEE